jgi:hypothetical protein
MNAKAALIKELLDGKVLTIMTCFKTVSLTNIGREIPRMIEIPFSVIVSRTKKEGKSKYGSNISWFEYRLNRTEYNKEGIKLMQEYLAEHMEEYRPKKKEIEEVKDDLFSELI